jgi:hypothetical protein
MRWFACAALISAHALLLGAALVCAAGCRTQLYIAPVRPPPGLLFTQHTVPLTTDFNRTPVSATKTGSAEAFFILIPTPWVPLDFAFGDASVAKAVKDGGLTEVHFAESTYTQVLGIFGNYEVRVYGE